MQSISDSLPEPARSRNKRRSQTAATSAGDRLPPHSEEAEQGVLGCALLDPPAVMGRLVEKLKGGAQVFYDLRHQTIYNALRTMYDAQAPIDLITVQERLKNSEALEQVGGLAYLSQLQDAVPSAANLDTYLAICLEKFKLRKLITLCASAVARSYEHEGDVDKLLVAVEAEISQLTEDETPRTEQHIKQVMAGVIADMEEWHYSRGSSQLRGLPTGPKGSYLDKILMGIRDTHYVTVAGRPGEGKSSWAMNLAEYLAADYLWRRPTGRRFTDAEGVEVEETEEVRGIPIGVFTIEMDNESLGYRLLFGRAGVSEAKYNQGFTPKGTTEKLTTAAAQLAGTNIWLDDTPGQSINQIAAKARRWAKQYGIKLFILDYLQLCQGDDPRDEERIKLDKISKKIMALKKQLKVPWLVLAQLNRNIETDARRGDRPPILSDLAGSGAIEQDADKVIIIKKTPRRELEKEPSGGGLTEEGILDQVCSDWPWDEKPTRMDLWVVKNRRGPRGHSQFVFQNNLCRFEDWHLWKVRHGVEERKEGESKHFGAMPSQEEMGV